MNSSSDNTLPIALRLMNQLRKEHPATYRHSVSVAALMLEIDDGSHGSKRDIALSGVLHDMGKLDIGSKILDKNGRPDAEELAIIRAHPDHGVRRLKEAGIDNPVILMTAHGHHQHWNGERGYPAGPGGKSITPMARLCAVADVLEAMTSKERSYREGQSFTKIMGVIASSAGEQFDPKMVKLMMDIAPSRLHEVAEFKNAEKIVFNALGLTPPQHSDTFINDKKPNER